MRHLLPVVLMVLVAGLAAGAEVPGDAVPADSGVEYAQTKHLRAVERLARLLLSEHKLDEARGLLEGDVKRITQTAAKETLTPDEARVLYLAGIIEEMAGSPVRRDELFRTARKLTPSDEFIHLLLGKVFEDLHREDIAEAEYNVVLELKPEGSAYDIEALERLAQGALTNRRYGRAADLFEKLLATLRTTTRLAVPEEMFVQVEYLCLVSRGHALLEEGKPDAWRAALEKCERAWKLDPTRIDAPVLGTRIAARWPDPARAEELRKTWAKRSEEVAALLRRSMTAEPHDPAAYNALAWLLAELDRNHDEGIRAAQRALELRPADPALLDTLAELQFKKGDPAAAIKTLRGVIDLHPFANDYYRRQLGRFEAALKKPHAVGVP